MRPDLGFLPSLIHFLTVLNLRVLPTAVAADGVFNEATDSVEAAIPVPEEPLTSSVTVFLASFALESGVLEILGGRPQGVKPLVSFAMESGVLGILGGRPLGVEPLVSLSLESGVLGNIGGRRLGVKPLVSFALDSGVLWILGGRPLGVEPLVSFALELGVLGISGGRPLGVEPLRVAIEAAATGVPRALASGDITLLADSLSDLRGDGVPLGGLPRGVGGPRGVAALAEAGEPVALASLEGEPAALASFAVEPAALACLAGEPAALASLAGESAALASLARKPVALASLAGEPAALACLTETGESVALASLAETGVFAACSGLPGLDFLTDGDFATFSTALGVLVFGTTVPSCFILFPITGTNI